MSEQKYRIEPAGGSRERPTWARTKREARQKMRTFFRAGISVIRIVDLDTGVQRVVRSR